MAINIQAKQDMSFLFPSLGSGAASVMGSNFLSDYASIKNGSYGKLMKAYYGETGKDTVKAFTKSAASKRSQKVQTSEETKAYTKVQTTSDTLKESADALLSKDLYKKKDITTKDENGHETTVNGYDTEAVYKAVSGFVSSYNSVVNSMDGTNNDTLERRVDYMDSQTRRNSKSLQAVGISVNDNGTLSLNKDTFMKADMGKVKSLFGDNGSYGYQISAQASLINYAADHAANKGSSYTTTGAYASNFSNGSLFSSYF